MRLPSSPSFATSASTSRELCYYQRLRSDDSTPKAARRGLSLPNSSYQLIQATDSAPRSATTASLLVSVGGSDQWGNITGIELYTTHSMALCLSASHARSSPSLIATESSEKLSRATYGLTRSAPPYQFYQFQLNTILDDDAERYIVFTLSVRPACHPRRLSSSTEPNPTGAHVKMRSPTR